MPDRTTRPCLDVRWTFVPIAGVLRAEHFDLVTQLILYMSGVRSRARRSAIQMPALEY
jgi:hypothetical protein